MLAPTLNQLTGLRVLLICGSAMYTVRRGGWGCGQRQGGLDPVKSASPVSAAEMDGTRRMRG